MKHLDSSQASLENLHNWWVISNFSGNWTHLVSPQRQTFVREGINFVQPYATSPADTSWHILKFLCGRGWRLHLCGTWRWFIDSLFPTFRKHWVYSKRRETITQWSGAIFQKWRNPQRHCSCNTVHIASKLLFVIRSFVFSFSSHRLHTLQCAWQAIRVI
jgi:hypothetical protein